MILPAQKQLVEQFTAKIDALTEHPAVAILRQSIHSLAVEAEARDRRRAALPHRPFTTAQLWAPPA